MEPNGVDNSRILLEAHLRAIWPQAPVEEFVWTLGPSHQVLPHLRVVRIGPTESTGPWVYATLGAWTAAGERNTGTEFVLLSPVETARHVETLFMVAYYQKMQESKLRPGSLLDLGHGWLDEPSLDHLLVSLPYPLGPRFEWAHLSGDLHIRYLWLLPITSAEAAFARHNGVEALEQRLEQAQVDPLLAQRPSVA